MQIEYTTRFVKDLADIKDKRAKKDTEKVLSIIRSSENFVDLYKMLDIKKYEFHGGYRIRYSGKPEWRIRFDLKDDATDPKKKVILLQLVLPREKYEKYAHTSVNESKEKVKLLVTEEQMSVLLENTWGYDPSMLSKFNDEIKKDISDARKANIKFYQLFKTMTIENVFNQPDEYKKLVDTIQNLRNHYYKKYDKYYNILETYDDYEDDEYYDDKREFDRNVSELDRIQEDMDTIRDMMEDVVDLFSKERIDYLEKYYPPEIIDMDHRIE